MGNGSGKRLCDAEVAKLKRLGKYKTQDHRDLVPLLVEAKVTMPKAASLIRRLATETRAQPVRQTGRWAASEVKYLHRRAGLRAVKK